MPSSPAPRYEVPADAWDCHVHVFDPQRFPYAARRSYTPGPASVDELLAFGRGIGVGRYVVVQPSVYGTDNACLLAALRRLGERARGVAVIDAERTSESELDALSAAGVRSVRINLHTQGERDPTAAARVLAATAGRVAPLGWSIQVYTGLEVIAALQDEILRLPVPLVIDHFGGTSAAAGTGQAGLAALLELLRSGRVYLKLSAPYRSSQRAPGYDDLAGIASTFIDAAPERLVWASDWPHTGGGAASTRTRPDPASDGIEPFRHVDVPHVLSALADWCGDLGTWRRILVDNPAILYDFY